ncbi:IS30 family transposase [Pseudanabaena sp. FACHB-1277]|uniref:IS30 family transposase n=1 Tax=Pseudanabaena cinerea FACHB-1277 TaxID=2949581 RepID=A0A926URH1_9CYAN|nr:IS30 family transposase [Pseudanabaena cinerea]MBD2149513.1 IS30 family transposase [Pseudanabaena cinerea FACHB-1277]
MSFTHLSTTERSELYKLRVIEQLSISEIGRRMNRDKSTISRELARNTDERQLGYLPDTAVVMMETRRKQAKVRFKSVSDETIREVKKRLEQHHSPEQLSGRMDREGLGKISYETIYLMIYANHQEMGIYQQYLRQKQKQRWRKIRNQKRGGIANRIGIENRPKVADLKTEIGHWESDTVIGCNHTGIVVTHVDKASKYLLAGLAKNKTMEEVNRVTLKLFEPVKPDFCKTMTFDNGREFCGQEKLSERLQIQTFFANPYHSWERGLNEHTNGLIREFYPKSTNFKIVKELDFQKVVNLINHRPRKSLDYRTPHEVFFASSEPVAFHP